jgi:erythronate-4-phosphate dehydrogenase
VVEYVLAALLALAADRGEELAGRTLAIVGVGQVGARLAPRAEALGMRTRLVDPLRAAAADARGEPHAFVALGGALAEADIVTLHTPLTEPGRNPYPTRGLLGADALARMRPGAWLVNAARGAVLDGAAALAARRSGRLGALVLDVWPGEPAPDPALVEAADFATPHIAGYAFDGKVAGTVAVERALRDWLGAASEPLPDAWDPRETLRRAPAPRLVAPPSADPAIWLDGLVRQAADLRADDARFRDAMRAAQTPAARAQDFAALRRTFPVRRHWETLSVRGPVPPVLADMVSSGLCIAG